FIIVTFFFFSSRRRHTRFSRDWSSDVCSSNLFGIKRMNRRGDFRASGSGHLIFDHHQIDEACVSLAFEANKKLRMQSAAFDFLFDVDGIPLIVEVSFGYNPKGYRDCEGWWDEQLNWHKEPIHPEQWMLLDLLNSD